MRQFAKRRSARRIRSAGHLLAAMAIRPASLGRLALASVVQALLVAPAPFLVKRAFEVGVGGGNALALTAAVGWLVALLLASEGMAALVKLAALRVTKPGTERLRTELASAINRLPPTWWSRSRPRFTTCTCTIPSGSTRCCRPPPVRCCRRCC